MAQMPLFNLFFLGLGWLALSWGVRRVLNNMYISPNPTEFGICRKHPDAEDHWSVPNVSLFSRGEVVD